MTTIKPSEAKTNWRLKKRIEEIYGSQAEFAFSIHIHESRLSQVIRGRRPLHDRDQKIWAKALKVRVDELF